MSNITDVIENYLKEILHVKGKHAIEIKRSEIADRFQCVPSQINYVINTRFTLEKGYLIESKRGGGGYIRISRVEHHDDTKLLNELISLAHPNISQQSAYDILERLYEKEIITEREMTLLMDIMNRETLTVKLPERDILRSRILIRTLNTLKYMK